VSDNKRVKTKSTYFKVMGYGLKLDIERPWDGERDFAIQLGRAEFDFKNSG
jgi:hypothetical protein